MKEVILSHGGQSCPSARSRARGDRGGSIYGEIELHQLRPSEPWFLSEHFIQFGSVVISDRAVKEELPGVSNICSNAQKGREDGVSSKNFPEHPERLRRLEELISST